MPTEPELPTRPFGPGAQVIVVEAPRGRARRARLEAWTRAARAGGASAAWLLSCEVERGGMWAGLIDWVEALLPALESEAPDLVTRHDMELFSIVPLLRQRRRPRYVTLTEASANEEAVRNYAADRAFRIGQGAVDLLDAWHARSGGGAWAVACDDFDRRGALVGRFFRELLRRRGDALGLALLAAAEPGEGERVAAGLAPFAPVHLVRLPLDADPEPAPSPGEAETEARALEARVAADAVATVASLHALIRLWSAAGHRERVLFWHAAALSVYNHQGFYEDALPHARALREALPAYRGGRRFPERLKTVANVHTAYLASGFPQEALEVIVSEGVDELALPRERARALYLAAMLHARFLPERDLEAGERFLHEALAEIERADLPPEDQHFETGFLLNGLAYVRFRQGRLEEAASLSRDNARRLDENLPPGRHRLHRSVLLYNAGQVHAQTGDHEAAVRCFTGAMEMDPNYSEYYNDRGSLFLKLGRLEEAERDYRRAIELSPPYPEVWFNLGQCLSRQGRVAEAEAAYARAVDLDPARHRAWVNLAIARAALGRPQEALAAYDAALAADGAQPLVLANRAALRLALGRGEEALADLERAVALAPENPALQRNRLRVLEALSTSAPSPN